MTTRPIWEERVRAWRASGQTVDQFSEGQPFEASRLRWWSSRVSIGKARTTVPLAEVVRPGIKKASLVVELCGARIHLEPGFDGALLSEVVRALRGGGA